MFFKGTHLPLTRGQTAPAKGLTFVRLVCCFSRCPVRFCTVRLEGSFKSTLAVFLRSLCGIVWKSWGTRPHGLLLALTVVYRNQQPFRQPFKDNQHALWSIEAQVLRNSSQFFRWMEIERRVRSLRTQEGVFHGAYMNGHEIRPN